MALGKPFAAAICRMFAVRIDPSVAV